MSPSKCWYLEGFWHLWQTVVCTGLEEIPDGVLSLIRYTFSLDAQTVSDSHGLAFLWLIQKRWGLPLTIEVESILSQNSHLLVFRKSRLLVLQNTTSLR